MSPSCVIKSFGEKKCCNCARCKAQIKQIYTKIQLGRQDYLTWPQ